MENLYIILIAMLILLIVIIFGSIIGVVIWLKNRNKSSQINFDKKISTNLNTNISDKKEIDKIKNELILSKKSLENLKQAYEIKCQALDAKLNLDYNENKTQLKQELITLIKKEAHTELQEIINQSEDEKKMIASQILLNTMQSISDNFIQENTTTMVEANNEQIKGRIIGKEGRNKRIFERLTGTELIVEKDNKYITISSYNPIRREIANLMLKELINAKSIEPSKIEVIYQQVKDKFNILLNDIGKDTIETKLNIYDLNPEIYPYIGRLKFRSSYGQNTLKHILECAEIASNIAEQLGLDKQKAKKVALLHDIGKSMDYEMNKNHIDIGVEIATKLNLDKDIINAIESHHGNVSCNNIYSEITKLADTISASRPGARINSYNEYFERVQALENSIKDFDEVLNAYVIKSGRQLRIMINPSKVSDNDFPILAKRIKYRLEHDEFVKGYNIKVVMIKENQYEFETDAKK